MLTVKRFIPSKVNFKVFLKFLIRGSRICIQGEECTSAPFLSLPSWEGQLSQKTAEQLCRAGFSHRSRRGLQNPLPAAPPANPHQPEEPRSLLPPAFRNEEACSPKTKTLEARLAVKEMPTQQMLKDLSHKRDKMPFRLK